MFDSGAEITIYDKAWISEQEGLSEDGKEENGEIKLTGIAGEQSAVDKQLKAPFSLMNLNLHIDVNISSEPKVISAYTGKS